VPRPRTVTRLQRLPSLAKRDLSRYVEQQPEYWAFQMLAANYKARGDMKRWQETLERSLGTEQIGLEHVQAQVELADYLMDQGQWAKAKDYAEAAGESFASWGMSCAQRCAEGMKDWPWAEQWAQRQTERYPEHADAMFRWYLFCVKTGLGNQRAARQCTQQLLQESGRLESLHPDFRANYAWLNGDLKAAAELLRESYQRSPSFGSCSSVMATADRLGDRTTVDEYRNLLVAKHRKEAPAPATRCQGLPGLSAGFFALTLTRIRPASLKRRRTRGYGGAGAMPSGVTRKGRGVIG
jgi:tetratricopeptide (TPR) repeat protein